MSEDRKASIIIGAENQTKQTFDEIKRDASDMAGKVEQAGQRANKGLSGIGDGGKQAAQKLDGSTRSIIGSIQRATAAVEAGEKGTAKYFEAIGRQRGVGADVLEPYLAQLRKAEAAQAAASAALGSGAVQFDKYGMSAKQTAAAMRGVPAQLTDIFVSLQGGQRPMTVLLQQGGQLKDMFGGVVPAARALATTAIGMVNPLTIAAAAVGAVGAAYLKGSQESVEYNKALTITGGLAGVSAAQLGMMADRIGSVVGTTGEAAGVLAQLAGNSKLAGSDIESIGRAAIAMSAATGKAVGDTVKEFEKLAEEPAKASKALNEQYNYLTTAVYEQIKALEEQGRKEEAAALAQRTYSSEMEKRATEVRTNAGVMERAWDSVASAAKKAWNAMLDVGRDNGLATELANAEKALAQYRDGYYKSPVKVAALEAEVQRIRDLIAKEGELAKAKAETARIQQEGNEAVGKVSLIIEKGLPKQEQMNKALADYRGQLEKIRAANPLSELLKPEAVAAAEKAIREIYKETSAGGIKAKDTELARLRSMVEAERQREQVLHSTSAAQASLNEGEKLALQYAEKIKLATDSKTVAQLQANKALAEEAGARKRANDEYEKAVKASEAVIDSVRKQTLSLDEQIATYGMGKSAIEEMTIARLEERLSVDSSLGASERSLDLLRAEIEERKKLLGAMRKKEALDAQKKEWEAWERDIEKIFDRVGQSLTDAIFEGGKSGKELLKDVFKGLTLNVLINPIMKGIQGMVTQQLGGVLGYQNPQQGTDLMGMASNASSLYSAASGGLTGNFANSIGWLGEKFGSSALSSFAAGMTGFVPSLTGLVAGPGLAASMGTTIGTSMAATSMSAAVGSAGTAASLGAAFSAALPWIGGALAIGSIFGGDLFGGGPPKTRHSQSTTAELANGRFGITSLDDRQAAGSEQAALAAAQASVKAANELFAKIGVNAGIESFYAMMESSVLGDRNGVASGGTLRVGDQLQQFGIARVGAITNAGFGGWSSAEMLPRLQTDIQMSILEAFQTQVDKLPRTLADMIGGVNIRALDAAGAQDLVQRFSAIVDGVSAFQTAVEGLPFGQLRDLSFDAAAGLMQLAGSLDSFLSAQQAYYEAFYSEAERVDHQRATLTDSLSGLGFALPATNAAYRALIESLDLTTESGQKAYTTLVQLAPQFAQLTAAALKTAQETAASLISSATGRDGLDMAALRQTLQTQTESVFVQTVVGVFQKLADRVGSIIDSIASERDAVKAAMGQIQPAAVMTPEAILERVSGINTALPDNESVLLAGQQLTAADALAAQRKAEERAALAVYNPALASYNAAASQVSGLQAQYDQLTSVIAGNEAEIAIPRKYSEGRRFVRELQATMPGLYAELEQIGAALTAAKAASSSAKWDEIAALANTYAAAVTSNANAQAAAEAAAKASREAVASYADELQKFALDATKSVGTLSDLRAETIRYYESQKALAELMKSSAEGLRKASYDYRFNQLDPEAQFRELRGKFDKAYSMALSTDGEALAGYADELRGLLNPLLDRASDVYGSDQALKSFIATMLARVDTIAGRTDSLAPTGYEAESLAVLSQIDATLAALNESTRSAEQILVDAINVGRDATVNGLRQIANALTGRSVAAFATGGYHLGGLRIVGENGPELEATGPARIFNAAQTREILAGGNSNGELLAEIRRLREEVSNLRAEARATASNTAKTARQLDRFEIDGMLVRTDAETPLHTEVIA